MRRLGKGDPPWTTDLIQEAPPQCHVVRKVGGKNACSGFWTSYHQLSICEVLDGRCGNKDRAKPRWSPKREDIV
jgi:hypothetical protein